MKSSHRELDTPRFQIVSASSIACARFIHTPPHRVRSSHRLGTKCSIGRSHCSIHDHQLTRPYRRNDQKGGPHQRELHFDSRPHKRQNHCLLVPGSSSLLVQRSYELSPLLNLNGLVHGFLPCVKLYLENTRVGIVIGDIPTTATSVYVFPDQRLA